jgi:uncharacterized membrane protein YagU involved in acid resistance
MARLLSGLTAGLAATVPMTAVMIGMHQQLPRRQRYPLPPRRITMRVLEKAGVKRYVDEPARFGLTMLAHFGYGASVGGIFGLLAPRDTSRSIAAGIGYGLLVWAGSYLGLLPSLGLHRPATREPSERNLLMIAAHIVWGAALGALAPRLFNLGQGR